MTQSFQSLASYDPTRINSTVQSINSTVQCNQCGASVAVKAGEDTLAAITAHVLTSHSGNDAMNDLNRVNSRHQSSSSSAMSASGADENAPRTMRSSSKFIREQLDSFAGRGASDDYFGLSKSTMQSSPSSDDRVGQTKDSSSNANRGKAASHFEEDNEARALDWNQLQSLDKPDSDEVTVAGARPGANQSAETSVRVKTEGGSEISAEMTAAVAVSNGQARYQSHVLSAADPLPAPSTYSASNPQSASNSAKQSTATSPHAGDKRKQSTSSSASKMSCFSPLASSQPVPSSVPAANRQKRRRAEKDEDAALIQAYERQVNTLNEAMRQLLAFVSTPFSSGTDAYVDELIAAYRGEYMKEQSREGRAAENKRYARAMAAYFLTYYHSTSINVQGPQFNLQQNNGHLETPFVMQQATASNFHSNQHPNHSNTNVHSSSAYPNANSSNQQSDANASNAHPSGDPTTSFSSLLNMPSDPFEGLNHPLYPHLSSLLYTVIDSLLMDTLQIAIFSVYLERLEPYWILELPPAAQARLLLLAAYAMKLAYVDNHSIYLPYLSGLYANFSQILSEYLHSKPGVKLGIQPQHLASRFRSLLASLSTNDS